MTTFPATPSAARAVAGRLVRWRSLARIATEWTDDWYGCALRAGRCRRWRRR